MISFGRIAVSTCAVLVLSSCSTEEKPAADPAGAVEASCVVGWGDSLTYALTKVGGAWQQANPTWLDTLGSDLKVKTINYGAPSQGSAEIAVRQGGLTPRVTVANNELPARSAGPVPITAISPDEGWSLYADAGKLTMHGSLAGTAGTLQHTITHGVSTFAFAPDTPPSAPVSVSPGTTFSGDQGATTRDCFSIIWSGTNNSSQPGAITADIQSMVHSMTDHRRYLIVGTVPAVAGELAREYGPHFVDLRRWLVSEGLAATGVPRTPQDTAAVANDDVPPSLTVDGTHFTRAAYTAIGHHLASVITG